MNQRLSQFRQWQQDSSRHIARPSDERHQCRCCGAEFTGNFCPQCGQKAGVGRITWKTVRQGVTMLWGMDSRSLPYTLWQLLLRPGHLIGDYIGGKRQVSFPPIKMLAIVAVFVFIVSSTLSPVEEEIEEFWNEYPMMYRACDFFNRHYDMGYMFFFSLLIIPTYFVFRYSPRCSRHNLPEGFYIQVFDSVIAMMLDFVVCLLAMPFDGDDTIIGFTLVAIFTTYRSYHQLFGYSHWSTLWRIIAVFIAAGLTLALLVHADYITAQLINGGYGNALHRLIYKFTPQLLLAAVSIAIPCLISRHTAKRRATANAE